MSVVATAGSGAAAGGRSAGGRRHWGAEAGCPAGAEGKDTMAARSW